MYILSGGRNKFINLNNVANIHIKNQYMHHSKPDTWWEIRVLYPAAGSDILYDTLCRYETEELCRADFNKLCDRIANGKENEVIDMKDL